MVPDTDDASAWQQLEGDAALAARLQQEEDQRQREDAVDAADAELAARLQLEEDSWREQRSVAGKVLLEGLVEKKPVRGLGMVERGLFGQGWRARRVLLRCQSREEAVAAGNLSEPGGAMVGGTSGRPAVAVIEWHHGDEDESEPSCLVLDPACARVRRGGDPGDEVDRCVTVESLAQSLVLRMSGVDERDAWLSGIGRCLKRLQAAAFDERVGEAVQRLGQFGDEVALRRASRREGVQLLMERFFGACAVDAGGEGEASSAASSGVATEEAWMDAMVQALLRCLLTRQAEERLRSGRRGASPEECERRELQLFPWHYEVARRFEEATWQLRDALAARGSLAALADLFDYMLGISQPFDFGGSWAPRDEPPERWVAFRRAFHEASMQRVLELALPVPEHLAALSDALAKRYDALHPGEVLTLTPTDEAALQIAVEEEGTAASYELPSSSCSPGSVAGNVLGGGGHVGGRHPGCVRCEVVRRMTGSSTQPLLLSVDALTPASRGALGAAAAAAAAAATAPEVHDEANDEDDAAPVMWSAAGERVFFKVGDDLRQDLAALLLLDEANALWRAAGLRCSTRTYRVVPTSARPHCGFIECLDNAVPIAHESGVGAFVWSRTLHDSAIGAFTAGFVLGLGDRHQDNMLLCGPDRDVFAHIDFGYVAGSRPWFDANLLPIPERFMNCCVEANQWHQFVRDMGKAFAVLQAGQPQLCAVAAALAEPLSGVGYAGYISRCLQTHRAEDMMALVEAAPHDLARRFKNLHHKLSHHGL